MVSAIFHAGGQTRDKKMETICKENTNTISFLKNVIKKPIKSPLSLVSLMYLKRCICALYLFSFAVSYRYKFCLVYCVSIKVLNQTICSPKETETFLFFAGNTSNIMNVAYNHIYLLRWLDSNILNRKRSIISFIVQIIAIFAVWIEN